MTATSALRFEGPGVRPVHMGHFLYRCPLCGELMRGTLHDVRPGSGTYEQRPPMFCGRCGVRFDWRERGD